MPLSPHRTAVVLALVLAGALYASPLLTGHAHARPGPDLLRGRFLPVFYPGIYCLICGIGSRQETVLPPDLLRDQHAWNRAYLQLAVCRPEEYAVLRRRLLHLSCRIAYHPHWAGRRSHAGWGELRRHAQHQAAQRLAPAA